MICSQSHNKNFTTSWWLLGITALTFLIQSFDTTMFYLAMPAIARDLHQPTSNMDTVAVIYLVAVVIVTPFSDWLMEKVGEQRVYRRAIALFAIAAFFCSQADSLSALVFWRLVQGVGGALMLPAARVMLLKGTVVDEQVKTLNLVTAAGLFGTLLGPLAGGGCLIFSAWRYLFWLALPLCLLCLFGCRRHEAGLSISGPVRRFDLYGYLLITTMLSLGLLLLSSVGQQYISSDSKTFLAFLMLLLGSLYFLHHSKVKSSVFRLSLFRKRSYLISIVGNALVRVFLSAAPLMFSLALQTEYHYTVLSASMIMLMFSLGSLSAKLIIPRILMWLGYRWLLTLFTLISALLLFSLSGMKLMVSTQFMLFVAFSIGISSSVIYSCLNTLAFTELNHATYGAGNNILTVVQLISILLSISLSFTFLHSYSARFTHELNQQYYMLFEVMGMGLLLITPLFSWLDANSGKVRVH